VFLSIDYFLFGCVYTYFDSIQYKREKTTFSGGRLSICEYSLFPLRLHALRLFLCDLRRKACSLRLLLLCAGTMAFWIGAPNTLHVGGTACIFGALIFALNLP
jgi:hypothetical protein